MYNVDCAEAAQQCAIMITSSLLQARKMLSKWGRRSGASFILLCIRGSLLAVVEPLCCWTLRRRRQSLTSTPTWCTPRRQEAAHFLVTDSLPLNH